MPSQVARTHDLRAVAPRWHDADMAVASPRPASPAFEPTAGALLLRLALDLGAEKCGGPLTEAERAFLNVARDLPPTATAALTEARLSIILGNDPLGEELLRWRSPADRRPDGAFYTPAAIVQPMVEWALAQAPERVVDAGCGSGRFAAEIARRDPAVAIVAVDRDPLATLLTRAVLAVLGAARAVVLHTDYLGLELPPIAGRTAWIGNPPYVRHHDLEPEVKRWAATAGASLGHPVSSLSGLHAYFFLATALHAEAGDVGTFVTSAEWLDVGYGALIRQLLMDGLGLESLHVLDPTAVPFAEVMTTAAIACFRAGVHPARVRIETVADLDALDGLDGGRAVPREQLELSHRWTGLLRPQVATVSGPALGTIGRVSRGVVTGANDYFLLTRERAAELGVLEWCRPAITSAREVLDAGGVVRDGPDRRLLFAPPRDVDRNAHSALDRYLRRGEHRQMDAPAIRDRYITSHRTPWWHHGPLRAPPIVASYMARRPPVFALNPDGLALVNIAHGLYPHRELNEEELGALVLHLNGLRESFRGRGRTYHGGLEKFEPGEMEALIVPDAERWVR
jgi:adenine-specific DNA-methyltransferase